MQDTAAAEPGTLLSSAAGSDGGGDGNAAGIMDRGSQGWDVLAFNFGTSATLHLDVCAPKRVADVYADPVAQHSATFLLEAMRGIPRMMTRPEAFPWFIHKYCRGAGVPGLGSEGLETLDSCTAIARLYLDSEPYGRKALLWPAVDVENRRFMRGLEESSRAKLLLNKQAQIVYIIVCMLDNLSALGIPEVRLQMLMTYEVRVIGKGTKPSLPPSPALIS